MGLEKGLAKNLLNRRGRTMFAISDRPPCTDFSRFFRICLVLFLLGTLTTPALSFAESPVLPEISGWENGELMTTALETVSGTQGLWQERTYRTPDGCSARAILMAGKGTAFIYPPQEGVASNDGPLGSGATYETTKINGCLAILENHPLLGITLTVNTPQGVLTLESMTYGMKKEDILEIADRVLLSM